MPAHIEDYALIGDCRSAALVDRGGSIDWLCWPRFDSPACFAALLGSPRHGRWLLAPAGAGHRGRRRYCGDTLIVETLFETAQGSVAVVDFMSMPDEHGQARAIALPERSHLVRLVQGRRGRVDMRMELLLRFDYGSSVPWVTSHEHGRSLLAVVGPDQVVLRTMAPLDSHDLKTESHFSVAEGECVPFVLSYARSHRPVPASIDALAALTATEKWWQGWSGRCTVTDRWEGAVRRSLITLKALTYTPTGGMVAAPTTSLPEQWNGVRNWDYRYCWLRDATLTLLALMNAGYHEEADAWRAWLLRAIAGSPEQAQIMYGIAGERRLAEWEVGWLPGYEGAAPVRVGNAAANQLQLDVYGEVMDAMFQARRGGLRKGDAAWAVQRLLIRHLEKVWTQPDEGIWEFRSAPRHFTYSKIMAWVALDRAVKSVETFGLDGPVEHWRELRRRIHEDVCRRGYDAGRGSFMQSYGSHALDASLLLIPITGFLPADDPRVRGTVQAIQRELTVDGLVHRYATHDSKDGLPAGEGAFLACTFWLADVLFLQQRRAEAEELFEHLLSLRNDVGLLAEQYDPETRRQMGNFPQAFSHVALINTALNLGRKSGAARQRGNLNGAPERHVPGRPGQENPGQPR